MRQQPWSYIAAVRLNAVLPAYRDRVRLRIRPFPLEIVGGGPPNRHELEQEWWLAAIRPLPCYGETCLEATRSLIDAALS